jgi:hypothetical protein
MPLLIRHAHPHHVFSDLHQHARHLVVQGIRSSTARTYSSAQRRFMDFCNMYDLHPLPCTEDVALLYIAHLDKCHLSSGSIRVYMSALRSLHIQEGVPYAISDSQRIKRALRAIVIKSPAAKQKLPITFDILTRMHSAIPTGGDSLTIAAAMSLAFFGCLRAAEVCVIDNFDPSENLCFGDVTFHSTAGGKVVHVRIKRSKTDTRNEGFTLFIGCIASPVCAHCCLQLLHASRLAVSHLVRATDPLLVLSSGKAMRKSDFISFTKSTLSRIGIDPSGYSGHSYRAGAATSGAEAGFADYELQLLGRWSSDAYLRYIRAPPALLSSLSNRLASPPVQSSRQPHASSLFG